MYLITAEDANDIPMKFEILKDDKIITIDNNEGISL